MTATNQSYRLSVIHALVTTLSRTAAYIIGNNASSLSLHHHWQCIITGDARSLAMHDHWRCTITGDARSMTMHHHWRSSSIFAVLP
jgi:hypothetical protein